MQLRNLVITGICIIGVNLCDASNKAHQALKQETRLEFIGAPLSEVLKYLSDLHGIQFVRSEDVDATDSITLKFSGQLEKGLAQMLRHYKLTYVVKGERIIVVPITVDEYKKRKLELKKKEADDLEREAVAIKALSKKRTTEFRRMGVRVDRVILRGDDVTDKDLVHLKSFTRIKILDLVDTKITDASLIHVKELKTLVFLSLRGNRITNEGVAILAELGELRYLDLSETNVNDNAIGHLKRMSKLRQVTLIGTMVSEGAAEKLKNAMPDLRVHLTE